MAGARYRQIFYYIFCIMKKKAFLLALCCCFLAATAQKVAFDKLDSNGVRYISTKTETFRQGITDRLPLNLSISTISVGDTVRWSLCVKHVNYVPLEQNKGAVLLIRTSDGTVHESATTVESKDQWGSWNNLTPRDMTKTYTLHTYYPFPFDELVDIFRSGIVKIRLQTPDGYEDKDVKPDHSNKICQAMMRHIAVIRKALATGKNTIAAKDIHEGF